MLQNEDGVSVCVANIFIDCSIVINVTHDDFFKSDDRFNNFDFK